MSIEFPEDSEDESRRFQDLLRVMSHEMKAPLVDIVNQIAMLQHNPNRFPIRVVLENIRNSAELALALNESISQIGIAGAHQKTVRSANPVDIRHEFERVRKALTSVAKDYDFKSENIQLRLKSPLSELYMQRSHLSSILLNSISNSIKYNARPYGEGWVSVVFYLSESELLSPPTKLPVRDQQKVLVIEVHDNGVGISPEDIPLVFQPGFRASNPTRQGLGLGLASIKSIVTGMEGDVFFESNPLGIQDKMATTVLRIDLPETWARVEL